MRKRFFSILMALALCLTLLLTAALADGTAFGDVSGHWAGEAITEWHEKGYIGGYGDGTFRPDSSITRAEFVKLLNRVLGLTAEAAISFPDVKESDWFYAEVAKAAAAGYAKGGTDGAFHPDAPITRTEAAVMLSRALGLAANESRAAQFADAAAIPAWAKGSVGAVADAGYMTGYPDGAFGAKDSITRAQAVVTLDRVQNVTVTADGTVLTDKTIAGDLIIAESVGEGEVTLKNMTVEGSLIIRGGGANSVYLDGVTVRGEVRLEKDGLHLRLQGGTKLSTVQVLAKVKLSGSGTIELLLVSADGVTVDRTLTVRKTETGSGVKAPSIYNPDSSGSSSGGSTSKTVTGAAAVAPVKVPYTIGEAASMSRLPAEVTLNCADGSTVSAAVTWTLDRAYDANPSVKTVYTATGTVTIPDGYTYSGGTLTVQTTLTVAVEGIYPSGRPGAITLQPGVPLDSSYELLYLDGAESIDVSKAALTVTPADFAGLQYRLENTGADRDWVSVHITGTADRAGSYTLSLHVPAEAAVPKEDHYALGWDIDTDFTCTIQAREVTGVSDTIEKSFPYNYYDKDYALSLLPETVRLSFVGSGGETVNADVTWALDEYDKAPRTTTTYTAIGTVTLPAGCTYSVGTLTTTAAITVRGANQTVTEIVWPTAGIEVASGTGEGAAMLRLPQELALETRGDTAFAPVTWERRADQTYDPTVPGEITYVGTVTLPDGYETDANSKADCKTTGETTITVLESGATVTKKMLTGTYFLSPVYIDSYIDPQGTEIKEQFPTEIRLECVDGYWVKGAIAQADWTVNLSGGTLENGYLSLKASCDSGSIELPDGYEFNSSDSFKASLYVYVKQRDNAKLQAALNAAKVQMDRTTNSQALALSTDKIYVLRDGEDEASVSLGVNYVPASAVSELKQLLDEHGISSLKDPAENYDSAASQTDVDALADEITTETEALQTALNNPQTGKTYTNENILASVRERLEKMDGGNYAYSKGNQPLTVEKNGLYGILLPASATGVQINNTGGSTRDTASVDLRWSIGDEDYAQLKGEEGSSYDGTGTPRVLVKGNNTKPKNLSLEVYAIGYTNPVTSEYVYFDETNHSKGVQVEAYNNLIVGAPIARDTKNSVVETPVLTSGQENTFTVRIPFQYNKPKIEAIKQAQITAICADGSLTDFEVIAAEADKVNTSDAYTYLSVTLCATATQLAAVVDSDQAETATVKLAIPRDAIDLTEWAKKSGWYIPRDGIELEGDVKIRHPLVKVDSSNITNSNGEVTVPFTVQYLAKGKTMNAALVPTGVNNFTGTATAAIVVTATATGNNTTNGDGSITKGYTAVFDVSDVTGDYAVWLQVDGTDSWVKVVDNVSVGSAGNQNSGN